ncbi:MAG: glycosyltransferase family 1 protein, partial [Ferruginibacter sp.]
MIIAVNCWILRNKQLDGIGNFTVETIKRLIENNPKDHFLIMCDKNFDADYFNFPNASLHKIFPPYRHPVLYFLYMETAVSRFLKKHKPAVFLSLDGFLSLSSSTKQVPVIYDLNFEHFPNDLKFRNRLYYRTFFKRFARKATRIATISEYSKSDIINRYGIDKEIIDNVSCGIKEKFIPLTISEITETRNKFSNGEPYFFFVGSMHPRKNIIRLINAFVLFKKNNSTKVKLVLTGPIWDDSQIKELLKHIEFKNDIIFTGRVSDDELKYLLGSALSLCFVPTFEGFGLPIVEAFQAGVPVICSNVTSMPEVAGDAALLVDPFNVECICGAMSKM